MRNMKERPRRSEEKMFLNDHNFAVLSTLFQLKAFWPFVRPFISHINWLLRVNETEEPSQTVRQNRRDGDRVEKR